MGTVKRLQHRFFVRMEEEEEERGSTAWRRKATQLESTKDLNVKKGVIAENSPGGRGRTEGQQPRDDEVKQHLAVLQLNWVRKWLAIIHWYARCLSLRVRIQLFMALSGDSAVAGSMVTS